MNEAKGDMKTEKLSAKIKLACAPGEIARSLSNLGISSMQQSANSITLEQVNTRDIDANPHKFTKITFHPNLLEIEYSVPDGASGVHRQIDAVSFAIHAVCASGACREWPQELFSLCAKALDEASLQLSEDYDSLSASLSGLSERHAQLGEKYAHLLSENDAQGRRLAELSSKFDSAIQSIKSINVLPDDVIDSAVMEHLSAHSGEIDVRVFARSLGIHASLVENSLNRLSQGGHIARLL